MSYLKIIELKTHFIQYTYPTLNSVVIALCGGASVDRSEATSGLDGLGYKQTELQRSN